MNLRRLRWAVRGTLLLGVAASVVANILHALDNPVSQAIAAWPPLALLLTVELISRVPVHRRSLAATRVLATAALAGIAAWVSYWHMVGVATKYGETGAAPYLIPISVDGLIVVASICLVELSGRMATGAAGHGLATGAPGHELATDAAGHELATGAPGHELATGYVASDGRPVDGPYVEELNDYERRMNRAIADVATDLGEEAEKFLAGIPPGMPLPQRRRPPAVPGELAIPASARELLRAWNGQPLGPDTPQRQAGTEVDQLIAGHFTVSQRVARRWRGAVLGPASAPPSN